MGSLDILILLTLKQLLCCKSISKQSALVSLWFISSYIYKLTGSIGSKEIHNYSISFAVCLTELILSEGRCWHTVIWCQPKFHCKELWILFKCLLISEKCCYLWPSVNENNPVTMFADLLHFPLTMPTATPAALLPSLSEAATHTGTVALVQWAHTRPSLSHKPWWSPEVMKQAWYKPRIKYRA